jgi:polysaccharide export outer membrane protein
MFKIKSMLVLGALFFLSGCSTSEYRLLQTNEKNIAQQKSVTVSDRSIEYRILSQDRLRISLYKDPQAASDGAGGGLGQDMGGGNGLLVNAAGYVPLPLIGNVKVAGLTQTGAANRITQEYKKYLNTPSVYVEVLNKRILVLGEVKSPGVVKIDKEKMTLFEALAHSGDFTNSALKNDIIILSSTKGKGMQMRRVDLTNFDAINYASLMLRPNDIVYVQPNGWKEFIVVSQDVTSILDPLIKLASVYAIFAVLAD